jgi:membrane-bound metal-dependent hydrolase YbcI (DUF457 family)
MTGIAVGASVSALAGTEPYALLVLGAVFGIAPDFDILLSGLSRRVHRSPATHSLLAAVLLAVAWWMVTTNMALLSSVPAVPSASVVFLSVFLHAAEDAATFQGCRFLYPVSRRRYKGVVRYDDRAANAVLIVLAAAVTLVALRADLPDVI